MAKLSLYECSKESLPQVPITDGQLVVCTDTGDFYRDTPNDRIPLGTSVVTASALPLSPIQNRLYLVNGTQLQVFTGSEWVHINEVPDLDASKIISGIIADARIPGLDASKITSGTIALDRLPKAALDTLVKVTDDDAMYKLTTDEVQNGDSVYVTSTEKMYLVVNDTKLDSIDGYQIYTAGAAATVDWSGVQNRPEIFKGATATDDGTSGLIPKPVAGEQNKYLRGDGSFSQIQAEHIGGLDATHRQATDAEKESWNNKYDAAIATEEKAGLVLSSSKQNQINVNETGLMTVNSVSTDLLFNGVDTLILDGGSSS